MRVVVDTNIFISAAMKRHSTPHDVLRLATEEHVILKSSATEQELLNTLQRPRLAPLIAPELRVWIGQVMASAEPVQIIEQVEACRDVRDDKFLELAVNGAAEIIVSGDRDLLALHPFRGIPIVTAAVFMQRAED
jgi:putative PIN family toxin of toxin-antitoxin system